MSADPSVSPADTPEVALIYRAITHLWYGKDRDAARVTLDALLAVGERDKADIEAAESLAAAHEGRAQSLAAEVERLEQALRESNDLRRVQRHSHDALSRRNVELTEAGERDKAERDEWAKTALRRGDRWRELKAERERDRRQIAQLTEALTKATWHLANYTFRGKDTSLGEEAARLFDEYLSAAVLADEEDAP